MTMNKEAIEKIVELAKTNYVEIDGVNYTDKPVHVLKPPKPDTLRVHSLTAIVDFVKEKLNPEFGNYLISVESPSTVILMSDIDHVSRARETYIKATCQYDPFQFGIFYDIEQFIIMIQAMFVQDETTAKILNMVGNITAEAKTTTSDDGVTQRVTAKAGIARVEEQEVPNPVTLRPYRTFSEVLQPVSKFVFRVKPDGPTCALFEADGGAWKDTACSYIKDFLQERIYKSVSKHIVTVIS